MFRPMFEDGRTFFDFLREKDAGVEKALARLKATADMEAQARGRIARLGAPMRTARESLDSVVMPLDLGEE